MRRYLSVAMLFLFLMPGPLVFGQSERDCNAIYSAVMRAEIENGRNRFHVMRNVFTPSDIARWNDELYGQPESVQSLLKLFYMPNSKGGKHTDSFDTATVGNLKRFFEDKDSSVLLNAPFDPGLEVEWVDSTSSYSAARAIDGLYDSDHQFGGLMRFSHIHVEHGNVPTAVLIYEHIWQSLGAKGMLAMLEKKGGTWRVRYKFLLWQS